MEFFFTNQPITDNTFFYEGPKVITAAAAPVNSSSIDTRAADGWRQGVELTQQRHYDAGLVKIWSGEVGHLLSKQTFGMGPNFDEDVVFTELDYFDAVSFIKAQTIFTSSSGTSTFILTQTFPIVTSDSDERENFALDGIIEPFSIRPRIGFFSMDVPFESHEVKGAVLGGNQNQMGAGDQVTSLYEFQKTSKIIPYLDMVDMNGNVPLPGFFINDIIGLNPFSDRDMMIGDAISLDSRLQPLMTDLLIQEEVYGLNPAHDNYVPASSISATSGFVYDSVAGIGTDSIAFGGMVY